MLKHLRSVSLWATVVALASGCGNKTVSINPDPANNSDPSGGNGSASATATTTTSTSISAPGPTPAPSNILVCNPIGNTGVAISEKYGLNATLRYFPFAKDSKGEEINTIGSKLDLANFNTSATVLTTNVFFNQVDVPSEQFVDGFPGPNGKPLTDASGNTLNEYFSLEFKSDIQLGPNDSEGGYQFATLSDDGSILELDTGSGLSPWVSADGEHASKFECASKTIAMTNASRIPMDLNYFEGPRNTIAMMILWRKIDPGQSLSDVECGNTGGDNYYFNETTFVPLAPMMGILSRGWKVLAPSNYAIPSSVGTNPCPLPTSHPSSTPTVAPTGSPSGRPTGQPPGGQPSAGPSLAPTHTPVPSATPSPSGKSQPPCPNPTVNPRPTPTSTYTVTPPMVPAPTPSGPLVCNPMGGAAVDETYGLSATLRYFPFAKNSSGDEINTFGGSINLANFNASATVLTSNVFFSQINVPSEHFTAGFPGANGKPLTDANGNVLDEYFSLDFRSDIQLGPNDAEGNYQILTLSDDGSILQLDTGSGMANFINADGLHSPTVECSSRTIAMTRSSRIPMDLDYFQGPHNTIAMVMMWRKIPTGGALPDQECGKNGGDGYYYNENTLVPLAPINGMLSRGWKVMAPDNFAIPSSVGTNPCPIGSPGPLPTVTAGPTGSPTSAPSAAPSGTPVPVPSGPLVCNPIGSNGGSSDESAGLEATLRYFPFMKDSNGDEINTIGNGIDLANFNQAATIVTTNVFFSQVNVPSEHFTAGFPGANGKPLTDSSGSVLNEYFSLDFRSNIKLSANDSEGSYEFLTLSDDGSILELDTGKGMSTFINSDGEHSPTVQCSATTVAMTKSSRIPMDLDYFQGPHDTIAMVMMWRKVPTGGTLTDAECGNNGGDSYYYDETTLVPLPPMIGMLSRGWKVLTADNFELPQSIGTNPCPVTSPTHSPAPTATPSPTGTTAPMPTPTVTIAPSPTPSPTPTPSVTGPGNIIGI